MSPLAYQAAKTAGTVIDYATTDQEKEGRELGIATAAKVYAPVFDGLESQLKKSPPKKKTNSPTLKLKLNFSRNSAHITNARPPLIKAKSRRLDANTAMIRALKIFLSLLRQVRQSATLQSAQVPCSAEISYVLSVPLLPVRVSLGLLCPPQSSLTFLKVK